ncbi:tRNA (adenosine(37)-N6)-dimethylallyltransferase MiaA [Rathayibacter rathayi]|uniref:tRNA dimethylallyltransferase n=1 Tax=Rathayibacter rathayi TaxID=33887 RepID=A0ABD6WA65_RATRA|nr:tRNA (adenosine(37)-N6)-dimethylallyltransferase MiaA [Rathayibacter rathayi]AZZ50390.1 tRNA (adenosine(37)-N6)-dimethylallyltransferase MiaA [Rathayibacter rathayi]MWV75729.1 tRNA (adenosine(37)-N6)-dimethylallyltransferase MiaA [Rathayibacter rathayi NCPPB 2980 = VKM Ac-1601]PPF14897.1 tRNA (adenosine(37)-N6)-dimethylallyltransferase MiaA [Rathayibacter rathayi]PPF21778.1 tRNA (adenosine(37)-N6)-dimethylallyltransferase MiaA [Rathayibacter rathayi]PPF50109.1 tRNA (adenosine(37)-N6)-dimeth
MASAEHGAPGPALIAIVGATGTGKTALSLDLAEAIRSEGGSAEIVNSDATQLYRGMDIGTAKLAVEERRGIPHHLFDVLDLTEEASVARYQTEARRVIEEVQARGATPILVGGSGLYVSSVLFEFSFAGTDPEVRRRLEETATREGLGVLVGRLRAIDEAVAERIGPHNARRIIRALEIAELTGGRTHSALMPNEPVAWCATSTLFLEAPREELVQWLDRRTELMWAGGMLDEVERLVPLGLERGVTARRAIGYDQALAQRAGTLTQREAIAATQSLTRRYARRQNSWFRRYTGAHRLPYDAPELVARARAAAQTAAPGPR